MNDTLIIELRLVNNPKPMKTKTGRPMFKGYGFGRMGLMGILAFNKMTKELSSYKKGDLIHVYGSFNVFVYEHNGEEFEELQIIAEAIQG